MEACQRHGIREGIRSITYENDGWKPVLFLGLIRSISYKTWKLEIREGKPGGMSDGQIDEAQPSDARSGAPNSDFSDFEVNPQY